MEVVEEPFKQLALWFSDQTHEEIQEQCQSSTTLDAEAQSVLNDLRLRLRHRKEQPRSRVEAMLHSDYVENIEAEILSDLYNPVLAGAFNAFVFGRKHNDLRFFLRPRGAFRNVLGGERVALVHLDPGGRKDGIWYLGHRKGEDHSPDVRTIQIDHYRLDTRIEGEKLTGHAELGVRVSMPGERILPLGLLPTLRVSSVTAPEGTPLDFIQEGRKKDSAFYVILPEALPADEVLWLGLDYRGDKVIDKAGGGNYSVGARTSWYPNFGAFSDRATFELTFDFPKNLRLVSIGKKVGESQEKGRKKSHWKSEHPVAVAGFNLGQLKEKNRTDSVTGMEIQGLAATSLPDYLKGAENIGGMSPMRLLEGGLVDAQNSLRLFTDWFGPLPHQRLAITQQPEFNFGQSWPSLIYLPIVAFFDSTQRWRLFGTIDSDLAHFVQEVTAHEVAHQWWGHLVGWKSYQDQWLSEGFAQFSAGLFIEWTRPQQEFLKFWESNRDAVLEKNRFGHRASEAGPISLGFRLDTFESRGAYSRVVYSKGAYVLHMLRRLMFDPQSGEERFRAMMREFVHQYSHQNPSTDDFQRVAEAHMRPEMDLEGNGRLDWFFDQWVHGTELPSYVVEYSLEPDADGKTLLKGAVTQSGVSSDFRMMVPLYIDLGEGPIRLGEATIRGNTTTPEFQVSLPGKPERVFLNAFHDVLALKVESRQR
jgi:hypothetical protein